MRKRNRLLSLMLCLVLGMVCNVTWAQSVIFPQEKQPGQAVVSESDGTYIIGNDLFRAKFVNEGTAISFAGCEELGLSSGGEIFKVQLKDGTEIPASEFTLETLTTESLSGNAAAVKGSHRFGGVQIKANFTHSNGLGIEWRAVLRDGSHYLRTELDITNTGTNGIEMYSITPMMYTVNNVDGEKAPAVVGNTRGAVVASDKIFAGLETPMGLNSAGETGDLDNFVYKAWTGASSFGWVPEDKDIPQGIKSLSEYGVGCVSASRGYLIFRETGKQSITLDYTGKNSDGNKMLHVLGVDVLDLNGTVVSGDYHYGKTGGSDVNNVYSVEIPSVGAYMVRYFVSTKTESIASVGDIIYGKKVALPSLVYDLPSTDTPYWTSTAGGSSEVPALRAASTRALSSNTNGSGRISIAQTEIPSINATNASASDNWTSEWADFTEWTGTLPEGVSKTGVAKYKDVIYDIDRGEVNILFDYTSGSHGLYMLGVQVLDADGDIVSQDMKNGFTGSNSTVSYDVLVPEDGSYTIRYIADHRDGGTDTNGDITLSFTAIKSIAGDATTSAEWLDAKSEDVADVPDGISALTNESGVAITNVKSSGERFHIKAGKLTCLYTWRSGSGNQRVNTVGIEAVDIDGNVVSADYHWGYAGNPSKSNTYSLTIQSDGIYYLRYYAETNTNVLDSDVDIQFTLEEFDVLGSIDEDETLADAWTPQDWKTIPAEEVPNRVNEAGCSDENARVIEQQITVNSAGTLSVEFNYESGSHRLNIVGVDLLDETGSVAVDDYHAGFTGTEKQNNIYKVNVFAPGVYTIRYFADNTESINSTGDITLTLKVDYTLHLIAPTTTPISGVWRRQTTLAAGEEWNISAVVGLIAPGQARRSFLAYNERERAVPWRAVPVYISWYELNIDRNNAAPDYESDNMTEEDCLPVVEAWKTHLYDKYGEAPYAFVWDDGWDVYGKWEFHSGFPDGFTNMDNVGRQMGAGQGAWLGPVGGYGTSGNYRRSYWASNGGMQLSNLAYYEVFVNAVTGLLKDKGYDFRFFKFDGISSQFSSVGPDAGATGEENAEAILMAERVLRGIKEDVFLNTTVGTWASPFWFQFTDAVWRQEKDYGEIGNNSNDRENWITYRDRLVYQNFVQNSPLCPINTLMTHGFILTNFSEPASTSRDWNAVVRELRCAFACGSGMVELYNDLALTNELVNPTTANAGELWGEIAKCMKWQRENADVLPDIHWVGGNPWTGAKAEVYGWAAWNAQKAVLTLRNGANDAQNFTFTLREVLDIPEYVNTTITLAKAFDDQGVLGGLDEGQPIDVDTEITVNVPGSSVFIFDGVDNNPQIAVSAVISEQEIGTFYANDAVNIPEGVTAYVATNKPVLEGEGEDAVGTIVMEKIENGIIPAKTGAVICAEEGTYVFTGATDDATPIENNLLKGYAGNTQYETVALPKDGATNYVLTVENDVAGFYRKSTAFKVYNHKAYLQVPSEVQNARQLVIVFEGDDATGIVHIVGTADKKYSRIYDLQGRRVKTTTHGVYVVDGRKLIK